MVRPRRLRGARVPSRSAVSIPGTSIRSQLVPPSYPDVQTELHPLAERSLLAHLGKLVKEGRARVDERGRYSASA